MADDAAILFLASGEAAARDHQLRTAEREARIRLGNIGASQVANLEAIAGCAQVGRQDIDVILLKLDDRAVADHVHVGRNRRNERVPLDRPQGVAPRLDASLGGADIVSDAAAVEQGVADVQPRREVAAVATAGAGQILIDPGRAADLRAPGGTGNGDGRVGRAKSGALGGDRRVGGIGRDERLAQRVGAGWRSGKDKQREGGGDRAGHAGLSQEVRR